MVLPAEDPISAVVRRMLEHKKDLIARDADTIMHLGNRWVRLESALEANMQLLAADMFEASRAGDVIARSRLFENRRYQKLVAQMADELRSYSGWVADLVAENQRNLAKLGIEHASEAVQLSLMESGQVGIYFDQLPMSAVETMIGITGEGAPVQSLLSQAYPMAVDHMTDTLIQNTLLGINPRETAREMLDGVASESLNHTLTVARTEQLRVYREAGRQQYESSGLVDGYRRLCAKNTETCAICLGLDGETYPTNELMHVHPQDRCTMVPNVRGAPPVEWETGEEWLRKQDSEVREQILGKGASEAWDAGDIELQDLAQKVEHPTWGPSLQRTPLKDLDLDVLPPDIPDLPPTAAVDVSGADKAQTSLLKSDLEYDPRSAEMMEMGATLGGENPSYKVTLDDGSEAILKPGIGESTGWAKEAQSERFMYEMSEELGFDIVPPTTVREAGTYRMPDGTLGIDDASIQKWVPNTKPAASLDWEGGWVRSVDERTFSQMTLMDTLSTNYDRHANNWLVDKNGLIAAIDNGSTFQDTARFFPQDILDEILSDWSAGGDDVLRFAAKDIDAVIGLATNDTFKRRFASEFGEDSLDSLLFNAKVIGENRASLEAGISVGFQLKWTN